MLVEAEAASKAHTEQQPVTQIMSRGVSAGNNFHSVHFSTNLFTPALYQTNGFAEMKSLRWITASNLLAGLK